MTITTALPPQTRIPRAARAWVHLAGEAITLCTRNGVPVARDTAHRDLLVQPEILAAATSGAELQLAARLLAESWIAAAAHYELEGAETLARQAEITSALTARS